ncbi:MAG: 1-aminocyclopropane-1-carboxylate deaminase [Saprospiraceae bacterium]|jgi:1-aminocyclopropane-1-carboxylate deaminase
MLLKKYSPLQEIPFPDGRIRLFIKRDDLLHPQISGNKWRKIKYNLHEMQRQDKKTLLTFGGAFSNHIAAAAAAGKVYGFQTIGIIRGEELDAANATLRFAEENGMHLKFISRTDYRRKGDGEFLEELKQEFGDFYMLPEGGTNCFALPGCAEIIEEIDAEILADYYCVACGTGGTIAGMISGLKQGEILGFSALKGDFLRGEVEELLSGCGADLKSIPYSINTDYHFGGYAKFKPTLIEFMNDFKTQFGISLDPIYTGKMFFGIFDLVEKGYFEKGSTVVAVHTGGLQGIEGFRVRYGDILS